MDIYEAIKTRRSVRAYSDRPIPPDIKQRLCEALRLAPSACNFQPWRFILVEDQKLRQKLAEHSFKQMWMVQAPLIVVGCGYPEAAYKKMGGYGNSVDIDLAIALDHLTLAAVSEGLGTCWIGAFDEKKVKGLLNVPKDIKVVAMLPVGYPAQPDLNRPVDPDKRMNVTDVFATDGF